MIVKSPAANGRTFLFLVMRTFILGIVFVGLLAAALRIQGSPLITEATPTGILALEFCNNPRELTHIITAWDPSVARWNVVIDFMFLMAYGLLLYHGCKLVYLRNKRKWLQPLATIMLSVCIIPSILDLAENILMLFTLSDTGLSFTLGVTPVLAWAKFILAGIIVLYLLVSLPLSYVSSKKVHVSK